MSGRFPKDAIAHQALALCPILDEMFPWDSKKTYYHKYNYEYKYNYKYKNKLNHTKQILEGWNGPMHVK